MLFSSQLFKSTFLILVESIYIEPEKLAYKPIRIFSNVVFPKPFGPIKQ